MMPLTLQKADPVIELSRHIVMLIGSEHERQSGVKSRIMSTDECNVLMSVLRQVACRTPYDRLQYSAYPLQSRSAKTAVKSNMEVTANASVRSIVEGLFFLCGKGCGR
jgi:hypothetical protein